MTYLRDLLRDPLRLTKTAKVAAPEPNKMRTLNSTMSGDTGKINVLNVADLQNRVAIAFRAGTLELLSRRELRQICGAFFHAPNPPGRNRELSDALLNLLNRHKRRMTLLILINTYLDNFREGDPDIIRLAHWLNRSVKEWPMRLQDRWAAVAQKYDLFEPSVAPRTLARSVMEEALPARVVLSNAGLDSEFRYASGLGEASFNAACVEVISLTGPKIISKQQQLMAWAVNSSGKLVYPGAWVSFAEACLRPWLNGEPTEVHKAAIISLLLDAGGGDPRMVNNGKWTAMKDHAPIALVILKRWLTNRSFRQFFEIVARSLVEEDAKRMWSYRWAFWESYLTGEGGGPQIEEAWAAFGADAADLARTVAKRSGDRTFEDFGRQTERSDQHSALVVKIAGMTIVDWSHNSKCQFWVRGAPNPPPLYNKKYYNQLYKAPIQEVHSSPQTYSWQKKFAEIIEGRRFYSEKPSWRPRRVW